MAENYPQVVKLARALEAEGISNSFTANANLDYPYFYVRVFEQRVRWRGIPTRKLEKLLNEVPIDKVPTVVGTDWMFEACESTQFFLHLRLKYGI